MRFERDFVHIKSREKITTRTATFDSQFTEALFKKDATQFGIGFQSHLDYFGFSIRIGSEIVDFGSWRALGDIILAIVGDARHVKSLDIVGTVFSIAISHIINCALVVLLEDRNVYNLGFLLLSFGAFCLTNVHLLSHSRHLVSTIAIEDDDVVDVGAILHKLILLQRGSHEAIGTIHIEFLVGFHHFGSFDGVERANLRAAGVFGCIAVVDGGEPIDGDLREMREIVLYLRQFCLDAGNEFIRLGFVEFEDACHLDFQETQEVFAHHFAHEISLKGFETAVDVR